MNITLVGYGKMGKMVEETAQGLGHQIVSRVDPHQFDNCLDATTLHKADICIDFSHPRTVLDNIKTTVALGVDMVVGTTGWYDHLEEVEHLVTQHQTGLFYAPNFSMGIYLFLNIVSHATEQIMTTGRYDVAGMEIHHKEKVDTPSGTAKAIAQTIAEKTGADPSTVPFSSMRCGSVPGTHTIVFDSASDTITLTHQARDRRDYARGAIMSAQWLHGRKGIFTFEQMMQDGVMPCHT